MLRGLKKELVESAPKQIQEKIFFYSIVKVKSCIFLSYKFYKTTFFILLLLVLLFF